MSISSSELKLYQAANMPEDDASTTGGAIATGGKVEFTDISSTGTIDYVSDGADTRQVTVTGRDATGAIVAETKTLNGTTPVPGSQSFERILSVVPSASSGSRTITLTQHSGGATLVTVEPNYTSVRRMFYDSASGASGIDRYEKFFWQNNNGSLTLNSAQMTLTADPSAKIMIGCPPCKGDSATIANRLAIPSSVTFVDDNIAQSLPS